MGNKNEKTMQHNFINLYANKYEQKKRNRLGQQNKKKKK